MEEESKKFALATMPFSLLCRQLDKIAAKPRLQKEDVLRRLWAKISTRDLWPLMRLLLPQLDTDRSNYGLREASIADMYIKVMGVAATSAAAQRLKNYKNPGKAQGRGGRQGPKSTVAAGDFATILLDALQTRAGVSEGGSTVTIAGINDILDALALGERDNQKKVYVTIMTTLSAKEQFWLTRIILKDLKIGCNQNSMLKVFHPYAEEIFNTCTNLKTVCEYVANPELIKKEMCTIQPFAPMRPMLCANPNWRNIVNGFQGSPFSVEPKYDGERILVHKLGSEFKLFTRNSVDTTAKYNYGEIMAPLISKSLRSVDSVILDGEFLTYDLETETFQPFGGNRTVGLQNNVNKNNNSNYNNNSEGGGGGGGLQLCYMCFDILYMNGKPLLNSSLKQRREMLEKIVDPIPKKFELVPHYTSATNTVEMMELMDTLLLEGHEGIIVKNLDSPYALDKRQPDMWVKLKPDYIQGLGENLDLIILGGYYGEGRRRAGGISHFLLGVQDHNRPANTDPENFYTFCKVGTGYSLAELKELQSRLEPHWREYSPQRPVPWLMGWKHEKSDIPDMYIHPRDSVILEMKCYEITKCRRTKFHAELTSRFPRVQRIRYDKDWKDCMSLADVKALAENKQGRKRAGDLAADEDERFGGAWGIGGEGGGGGKKKGAKRKPGKNSKVKKEEIQVGVLPQYKPTDISHIQLKGNTFANHEFCVISSDIHFSKQQIESLIAEYGGVFTQNPSPSTDMLIAGPSNLRVKVFTDGNLPPEKQHDVVHYSWLQACVAANSLVPFTKKYVMYATETTRTRLAREIDEYGDLYAVDATKESLLESFVEVRNKKKHPFLVSSASSDPSEAAEEATPTSGLARLKKAKSKDKTAKEILPEHAPVNYLSVFESFDDQEQEVLTSALSMFRNFDVYLDCYSVVGDPSTLIPHTVMEIMKGILVLYGAKISTTLHSDVTHVVINDDPSAEGVVSRLAGIVQAFKAMRDSSDYMVAKHYVTPGWVKACLKENKVVRERDYIPQPNRRKVKRKREKPIMPLPLSTSSSTSSAPIALPSSTSLSSASSISLQPGTFDLSGVDVGTYSTLDHSTFA